MRQIICVHVGHKYADEYLEKLFAGICRNSTEDLIFTVITNRNSYAISDPRFRIVSVDQMEGCKPDRMWWYKMQAFRPDIAVEENLLIDVDVVITGSTDKLWDYKLGEYMICQDFNRQWIPNYKRSNSSVVRFTREHADQIYRHWKSSPLEFIRSHRGDQDYMDAHIHYMQNWPRNWIMSWKWEVYRGGMISSDRTRYRSESTVLDIDTCILAFHGKPDPHEVNDPVIMRYWNK